MTEPQEERCKKCNEVMPPRKNGGRACRKRHACPHGIKPAGNIDGCVRCIECSPKNPRGSRAYMGVAKTGAYLKRRSESEPPPRYPGKHVGRQMQQWVSQEQHLAVNRAARLPAGHPESARHPNGSLKKGGVLNAMATGRRRHQLFRTHIRELFETGATDLAVKFVARTLGIEEKDIPEKARESGDRLYAWFTFMKACAGDDKASTEILARVDPPPKRVEVSGPGGGPVRTSTTPGADDGGYYDSLDPPEDE